MARLAYNPEKRPNAHENQTGFKAMRDAHPDKTVSMLRGPFESAESGKGYGIVKGPHGYYTHAPTLPENAAIVTNHLGGFILPPRTGKPA